MRSSSNPNPFLFLVMLVLIPLIFWQMRQKRIREVAAARHVKDFDPAQVVQKFQKKRGPAVAALIVCFVSLPLGIFVASRQSLPDGVRVGAIIVMLVVFSIAFLLSSYWYRCPVCDSMIGDRRGLNFSMTNCPTCGSKLREG